MDRHRDLEDQNIAKLVKKFLVENGGHLTEIERIPDEISRILYLLAIINTFVERKELGRLIIVGGFSVEIYSGGGYRTGDIDLIVEGREAEIFLGEVLRKLGFEDIGRILIPRELRLMRKAVDIVGVVYDRPKDPVRVEVDQFRIYLLPPEEVVVTCLNAYKYWSSDVDFEKAAMVLKAQENKIDWTYLDERARQEGIHDVLEELKELIRDIE